MEIIFTQETPTSRCPSHIEGFFSSYRTSSTLPCPKTVLKKIDIYSCWSLNLHKILVHSLILQQITQSSLGPSEVTF